MPGISYYPGSGSSSIPAYSMPGNSEWEAMMAANQKKGEEEAAAWRNSYMNNGSAPINSAWDSHPQQHQAPQQQAPQSPAPASAPAAASPAPAPAPEPAPEAGPAMMSLEGLSSKIDAGAGWANVATPGRTSPGLGQRLPFTPARSNGVRY